jgi:hypothetical protein
MDGIVLIARDALSRPGMVSRLVADSITLNLGFRDADVVRGAALVGICLGEAIVDTADRALQSQVG